MPTDRDRFSLLRTSAALAIVAAFAFSACRSEGRSSPQRAPSFPESGPVGVSGSPENGFGDARGGAEAEKASCDLPKLPSRYPPASRIVAIGDLHGDLEATRAALRLAGAIDEKERWIGGELVVVQTGDILDRGNGEQAILDLFAALAEQAARVGGAVHVLNGNHELMNAAEDFRYVTRGGFDDFAGVPGLDLTDRRLGRYPAYARPRVAAFLPGGPYARLLAGHNAVEVIGDTVFVHGGVTPKYAEAGIEALNREIRCWLAGQGAEPRVLHDEDGPLWSERYSRPEPDCAALDEALETLGAARMVMGHEVYLGGISSACDGKAWRIDVGLSALYGGPLQVLELTADGAKVLAGRAARKPVESGADER